MNGEILDKQSLETEYKKLKHMEDDLDDEKLDIEEAAIMREIRERRYAEMKNNFSTKQENAIKGHGQYQEIDESEFLPTVTKSTFVIVHFYHNDFQRCKIIDMHLRTIAHNHPETKFTNINAEKCPFFVARLQV